MPISRQNTLLASGSSKPKANKHDLQGKVLRGMGEEERAMAVAVDSIDPEAIWRRKTRSVVNIGRVDGLGRYRSSLERLPDYMKAPPETEAALRVRLGRVVRKLVSKEVTEAQEEMAWQMADMLVKEVMEATMKSGSNAIV